MKGTKIKKIQKIKMREANFDIKLLMYYSIELKRHYCARSKIIITISTEEAFLGEQGEFSKKRAQWRRIEK